MNKSAMQWMVEPLMKYATFSGRARRKEYWWFTLIAFPIFFLAQIVLEIMKEESYSGTYGILFWSPIVVMFMIIVPYLAVSIRRLQDMDKSGLWIFINFIPILGGIILLFWFYQPGTVGQNRFGPDPIAN